MKDDIPEKIKNLIKSEKDLEKYEKAKVDNGESVGLIAAQSFGERATQLTLITFHFAGVAELKTSLGLPRLKELMDLRSEPKIPITYIFLKTQDEEKIKKLAKDIEEKSLSDFTEIIPDYEQERITLKMKLDVIQSEGLTPEQIVKKTEKAAGVKVEVQNNEIIINLKKQDIKNIKKLAERLEKVKVKGISKIKRCAIVKKDNEIMLQAEGNNLEEILKLPEVDPTRTYSNNLREVEKVLGLEAAREVFLREVEQVLIQNKIHVDVRHLLLVADAMCVTGRMQGIGRTGMAGAKKSPLACASFEVPITHLTNASTKGLADEFKGIIENVIIGKPIYAGTGTVKLVLKKGEK
ncbi:MAG: DNA-directed RNA polymerase subunit A'' [archaeon]